MSLKAPNYTRVPNEILDALPDLKDVELRLAMLLCRETFGWQRGDVCLSFSEIVIRAGLSRSSVTTAVNGLTARNWLIRSKHGQKFCYSLDVEKGSQILTRQTMPGQPLAYLDPKLGQPLAYLESHHIKGKERPLKKKGLPLVAAPPKSDHQTVFASWCMLYEIHTRSRYKPEGAKDGSAIKRLLQGGFTVDEILEVATQAWSQPQDSKHFWACNRAGSISFFASQFNQIRMELAGNKKYESNKASGQSSNGKHREQCPANGGWGEPLPDVLNVPETNRPGV